jgi:hypothetical protein
MVEKEYKNSTIIGFFDHFFENNFLKNIFSDFQDFWDQYTDLFKNHENIFTQNGLIYKATYKKPFLKIFYRY